MENRCFGATLYKFSKRVSNFRPKGVFRVKRNFSEAVMKKKFLLAALGLAAVTALSLGVAACGGEGGDWTVEKVYSKARSCGYRGTVAELKAELAAHAITDLGTTENGADHEHVFPEWTVVLESACDSIGISFRQCALPRGGIFL